MALTRNQIDEFERLIKERRQQLVTELLEDVARARDESYADVAGSVEVLSEQLDE